MLVGLYPRVSTIEQAQHGHSIDEQIDRMQKYCDAMGWTVFRIYTDAGFSGASMERPALQRMIRDIKKGKIEKVVVYKLDRLSRSQKDTLELIEDIFLANGVDFVSLQESFDTSTPLGRAMIGILAVFAQLEREQIKERMAMGKIARGKKGNYMGVHTPIGYDKIDGQLTINDFESLQVKRIFDEYIRGVSIHKICDDLNTSGLTHKYGEWSRWAVRHILQQRTYVGDIRMHDQWYKGKHEPIISQETFDKAQAILNKKSQNHAKNIREGRLQSYLAGILICGHCGAKYFRTSKRIIRSGKTYEYAYYECCSRSKKEKSMIKDSSCKNKNWKMEKLDDLIFDQIRKLAIDPAYIAEITDSSSSNEDNRTEVIELQISRLDDQISRLMDLYSKDGIPLEILEQKIQQLNDQKVKLEHEIEGIKKQTAERLTQSEAINIVASFEDILSRNDFFEIREVITTLIDRIEINGDDITIFWAFS